MRLTEKAFTELLDTLAAATPTPGGGSASALAASVGLALLEMVSAMTRTRTGNDESRRALDQVQASIAHLRDRAVSLVDDDAAAYDAVVTAYRLPKTSEADRAARSVAVQSALRGAAEVPLEVMRVCQAALAAGVEVARHGNPSAASDVGVAVELLMAALRGARLNVAVNLSALDDPGLVSGVQDEIARLEQAAALLAGDVRTALSSA